VAKSKRGNSRELEKARKLKWQQAKEILTELGFVDRQTNDTAIYSLLALADLKPEHNWMGATSPLIGITPIITFIKAHYGVPYAPNTRETIRDEAVKHFLTAGLVIKNPDAPERPTNSGRTVYQIEPSALELLKSFGSLEWSSKLESYLANLSLVRIEINRERKIHRIPVSLPSGDKISLSPGGQNPLIKLIIDEFCPRFTPDGRVLYIGDTESKFQHYETSHLSKLGITLSNSDKMPDVIIHLPKRKWLVLIEAVTTAGPIDGKRRMELKKMFNSAKAGLVFVSAFVNRTAMRSFLSQISWETEVWTADSPDHLIHFNGERFLGPYDDVLPART
jgi:hypothetical protein